MSATGNSAPLITAVPWKVASNRFSSARTVQDSSSLYNKHINTRAEEINAGIQWVKYRARGYRNRQRFWDVIYCHFGGLDVYPKSVARSPLTHTNS